MPSPSLLKSVKLDLATLAQFDAPKLTAAIQTRLSEIDSALSRSGPYLGALRYFAKVREISLAELVEKYGSDTRKAFENAKPYQDILAFFGATAIPSAAFDAITRAQARTLATAIPALKKDTAGLEKMQSYLAGPCKFRDGWTDHLLTLATPPAPVQESTPHSPSEAVPDAAEGASDETPAPVVEIPASTPPPELDLAEFFEAIRALASRLPTKQLDLARANLARAVNSPDEWAAFCKTAATPARSNVIPMNGQPMEKAA